MLYRLDNLIPSPHIKVVGETTPHSCHLHMNTVTHTIMNLLENVGAGVHEGKRGYSLPEGDD